MYFIVLYCMELHRRILTNCRKTFDLAAMKDALYYIVNENGFSIKDSHENNFIKWIDFEEAIISKNIILLLDNDNVAIFLSKNIH